MRLEEEKEERRRGILALSASPWPGSEGKGWTERYWGPGIVYGGLRAGDFHRLFLRQVPADDTGSRRHRTMGASFFSPWCLVPCGAYTPCDRNISHLWCKSVTPIPILATVRQIHCCYLNCTPKLHLYSPPPPTVPPLALPFSGNVTTVHETTGFIHVILSSSTANLIY